MTASYNAGGRSLAGAAMKRVAFLGPPLHGIAVSRLAGASGGRRKGFLRRSGVALN